MSAAAARIAQEAMKPDVSIEALAQLAHADAAFAMKLLALVNSPAFARSHTLSDINQAASLLGIRGLRTVALSLLVSNLCPEGESCRILMANSLRRAVACKLLARAAGYKDLDGCFATGLFLDSGLLCHAEHSLDLAAAIAASPAHHRVLRELSENLEPHPERGAAMAQEFGLPADTVQAILHHHAEQLPEGPLSQLAWLAEVTAGVFESADVDRARHQAMKKANQLGIGAAQMDGILEEIPTQVGSVAQALQSDVGTLQDLEALRNDAGRQLSEINQQYEGVIRKLGELLREKEALTERLRQANLSLEAMALTDKLTGLCNRRALEDTLTQCTARAKRDEQWLSLAVLDVDHFKSFNDTYGHQAGDAVLETVGRVLQEAVRACDIPARYGGEEFTLVMPNTDAEGAQIVAERVRARLAASHTEYEGKRLQVTASFGVVSAFASETEPWGDLIARADEALYSAKKAGRNRVEHARSGVPCLEHQGLPQHKSKAPPAA